MSHCKFCNGGGAIHFSQETPTKGTLGIAINTNTGKAKGFLINSDALDKTINVVQTFTCPKCGGSGKDNSNNNNNK